MRPTIINVGNNNSPNNLAEFFSRPWIFVVTFGVRAMALGGNAWTDTAIAIERYLYVCQSYKTKRIHLLYTMPITVVTFILNLPFVLMLKVGSNSNVIPRDFAENNLYIRLILASSSLQFMVPFMVLTLLSGFIMKRLWKAQTDTLSGR